MSFFEKVKNIKCEFCEKTIGDIFEGDEDNEFLDVISSPWFCSEWCYNGGESEIQKYRSGE